MKSLVKTSSELRISFSHRDVRKESGVILLYFTMTNPYFRKASLVSLKYQNSAGEWLEATPASPQPETDLQAIPLTGKPRKVAVAWSAVDDFGIMQSFPGVPLAAVFSDRPNGGGAVGETLLFTADVDFTVSSSFKLIRPRENDPYLTFEFITPTAIRPCRLHFRITVDTLESLDSPDAVTLDSALDPSGWTADGAPFPEEGIDGTAEHRALVSDPALEALNTGTYYYRIEPVTQQFYARINQPADGQVFIGSQVPVSGQIETF